jgi:hypothetical protein
MGHVRNAIPFRNTNKTGNTIRYRKLGLALAAAAVLVLGFALPGSAKAATIVPYTGSGCNTFSIQPWHNCTTVNGGGLKINWVSGYAVNGSQASVPNAHVEIYGPRGHIKNCGTFTLGGGLGTTGPICNWTNPNPGTNQPAGDYCTVTWEYVGNGNYQEGGPECVNVHS